MDPENKDLETKNRALVKPELDETITELPLTQEMVVVARTPQELVKAQAHLVGWVDDKIIETERTLQDLETNIEVASKNRWRTSTLKTQRLRAQKETIFYKKVKAALEAGYYLIPNFPIDVFAIRTEKKRPRKNESTTSLWRVDVQRTESPPLGKGRFVDASAEVETETWTEPNKEGKQVEKHRHRSVAFQNVSFPFVLARPEVMNATATALAQKLFDEIGMLPGRPGNVNRISSRGDPMIIGRVITRRGNQEKSISFLISWFVDTRDL